MRPTKICLQGFASFRERVDIDLADVDLFVLSGSTGAGKSSILDAMTFALYGSVPRYDDRRAIAPALTQGADQGMVRLEFTVDGQPYVAVRVIRRTKTGATTKEARLERVNADGSTVVVAGNPDAITDAVTAMLGLEFDEFTKTVVLPQGEFAQFLKSKPKQRQDMLVNLLGAGIYRDLGSAARERQRNATIKSDTIEAQIGDLAHATPDAVADAEAALKGLEAIRDDVVDAQDELDALTERGREAREHSNRTSADVTAIGAIAVPAEVAGIAERVSAADGAIRDADAAKGTADETLESAESDLDGLPDPSALRDAVRLRERLNDMRDRHAELVSDLKAATDGHDAADGTHRGAAGAVDDLRGAVSRAERTHAGKSAAHGLEAGDDCPTCDRALDAPVDQPDDDHVAALRDELARAEADLDRAGTDLTSAASAKTRAEAAVEQSLEAARDTKAELADVAAGLPGTVRDGESVVDLEAARAALAAVDAAESAVRDARAACRAAAEDAARARRDRQALDDEAADAWERFDQARDAVAHLSPPQPPRDDLAGAWQALTTWAAAELPDAEARNEAAQADIRRAVDDYNARRDELVATVRAAGVDVDARQTARDAVFAAVASSTATLTRLRSDADRVGELTEHLADLRERAEVAKSVGMLLHPAQFERWMLNRVMGRIVQTASQTLLDLSGGAYSLTTDDNGDFEVIDHSNADEARSVKTLSGGETFMTSLSLALALSEHVAAASATGVKIESLFLDEGFGTLDGDTLDMVATAIEELGQRGKLVGVITHLKDLAERIPVRLEVVKTPTGSTVTRHAA